MGKHRSDKGSSGRNWVSWEGYCAMTEEERASVTVVTFTGVDEGATLGAERRAGDPARDETTPSSE